MPGPHLSEGSRAGAGVPRMSQTCPPRHRAEVDSPTDQSAFRDGMIPTRICVLFVPRPPCGDPTGDAPRFPRNGPGCAPRRYCGRNRPGASPAPGTSPLQAGPSRPVSLPLRWPSPIGSRERCRRRGSTSAREHRTPRPITSGKHIASCQKAARTPGYGIGPSRCTPCYRARTTVGPGCPRPRSGPRAPAALPKRRTTPLGKIDPRVPGWVCGTFGSTPSPDPPPLSHHQLCGARLVELELQLVGVVEHKRGEHVGSQRQYARDTRLHRPKPAMCRRVFTHDRAQGDTAGRSARCETLTGARVGRRPETAPGRLPSGYTWPGGIVPAGILGGITAPAQRAAVISLRKASLWELCGRACRPRERMYSDSDGTGKRTPFIETDPVPNSVPLHPRAT